MTFLSRSLSLDQLKTTFLRFPLALFSSTACAMLIIWSTWTDDVTPEWVTRSIPTLFVGILFFGGLSLLSEGLKLRSWLIQLLGIPVLYFLIYSSDESLLYGMMDMQQVGLVFVASLALIFSGSRLARQSDKEEKVFWGFAISTWFRALVSIASALVLVVGFQLALFSIEQLFDLTVSYHWPETMMAFFCVFVASFIFYTGIPSRGEELENAAWEEKSIRSIAHYLSFPLLLTYFLILSVYVIKIITTQNWPEGWVALPVLLFTLLGFGTFALVYPVKDDKKSWLIRGFVRFFPYATLPFLLVYFVAFWMRISAYGVTEMRAMGVLLGVVITLWALHFGFYKKPTLRTIPVTLAFTAFLFSFGPWGVSSFSQWSQMNELQKVLITNGILVDGQIVPTTEDLPSEVDTEVSSKVDYLVQNYGSEVFVPWFGEGVTGMDSGEIVMKFGLSYYNNYFGGSPNEQYFSYWSDTSEVSQIAGYDSMLGYYGYSYKGDNGDLEEEVPAGTLYTLPNGGGELTIALTKEPLAFTFDLKGKTYSVPLDEFVATLNTQGSVDSSTPREVLSLSVNQPGFKAKIYFNSISWTMQDEVLVSMDVDTDIYFNAK